MFRYKFIRSITAIVAQQVKTNIVSLRMGFDPGLSLWVKDQHCHKMWQRWQMRLRSGVAVAVV